MSYAAKCNLDKILRFKNRHKEWEKKYAHLPFKTRTRMIIEGMATEECVGEEEIRQRIKAIELDKTLKEYFHFHHQIDLVNPQPLRDLGITRLIHIGKLKKEEKQAEAFIKAYKEHLTTREVADLVKNMKGTKPPPKKEIGLAEGVIQCPQCKHQIPITTQVKERIMNRQFTLEDIGPMEREKLKGELLKDDTFCIEAKCAYEERQEEVV